MKIKCTRIINEHTQKEQETSDWLTIGKEYLVLAIEVHPTKNLYLMVDESSNQAPHLHDAKQFEVLSHKIPSNWVINPGDLEVVTIGPKIWCEPNFWEDCYDHNPKALVIYKREAQIIYEEEGLLNHSSTKVISKRSST